MCREKLLAGWNKFLIRTWGWVVVGRGAMERGEGRGVVEWGHRKIRIFVTSWGNEEMGALVMMFLTPKFLRCTKEALSG